MEITSQLYRRECIVLLLLLEQLRKWEFPKKLADNDYEGHRTYMLPEECVAEEFEVGEMLAIRKWYP